MWETPEARACATAAVIAASYIAFEHCAGIGTLTRGTPAAAACLSSNSSRTACMATRAASWLIVVSNAVTSNSPAARNLCSVQALSLPLLQESHSLGRDIDPLQASFHAYQFVPSIVAFLVGKSATAIYSFL